ncbi:MAG TPA: ankyrin repeat domain-containing protein [Pirellulales bacterium]|jgi:ankyrin repeat protein|nr:ankyrin repeat domain-containing protein [Pirellulales bacterium]
MASDKKIRRFFGFSLRQLLLLFALWAVLLGLVTPWIRQTLLGWEFQEDSERRLALAADLNEAVRTNDVALARQALAAEADPNRDPWEELLQTCIVNGRVEMMELLLASGMDAERPIQGYPPVVFTAGCKNQPPGIRCQMIRILVAAGADPRRQFEDPAGGPPRRALNAMDIAFGWSDARTGELLREYGLPYGPREMVGFDRLDELKRAVEQSPGIVKEDFRGRWTYGGERTTLLAIAVHRGYREIAEFLIASGAPLDTVLPDGSTLLHLAAHSGDVETIRLLLARRPDVNAVNGNSDTPLTVSIGSDKPQAVAALLEAGANVNHRGWLGRTPLHRAVLGNHIKIVQMLLAAGADGALPDQEGKTPLDLVRTRTTVITPLLEQAVASQRAPMDD